MMTALHEKASNVDLVLNNKKTAQKVAKHVDPDSFPIIKLSADLIEDYESVW